MQDLEYRFAVAQSTKRAKLAKMKTKAKAPSTLLYVPVRGSRDHDDVITLNTNL